MHWLTWTAWAFGGLQNGGGGGGAFGVGGRGLLPEQETHVEAKAGQEADVQQHYDQQVPPSSPPEKSLNNYHD